MHDFPELITRRLRLRRLQLADLPSLIRHVNNPKISDQILNIPYPYGEEDAIRRLNFVLQGFRSGERFVFAITMLEKEEVIGEIGLHPDKTNNNAQFGYWVAEHLWGQGIATEAAGAILAFGFNQLGLHKIFATHYPDNVASGKVLVNNGMVKEGELKDHYKVDDKYRTVLQYRLTSEEFAELRDREQRLKVNSR